MGNLQASPSSSTTTPKEKYDVFINFRGKDIRDGFANTLREALKGKQIGAFMDDQLPKGERNTQLFKTIEESKISIVIFSEDYGSSKWCLNELVKIMECNKINKQTVIPVFYGVKPSAVRKDSFVKLEEKFPEEVPKWKEALIDASRIEGWESFVTRPDTKLVTTIVDDIYKKLWGDENISSPSDFKGLIGLEKRIDNVKSLCRLHETDVRTIGILGMGGIGKTTLARVIFKQISRTHHFKGVCFVEDVGGKLKNSGGLDHLQEDILSKVLNEEKLKLDGPGIIPQPIMYRLKQTKVLIVLDNVDNLDDVEQLKILASGVELGQGSRIIITSRDKLVLLNCGVDKQNIHEVEEFKHREALQLFCNRAFNQDQPTEDLWELSNDIVNYAGGNPLALTVFGSSLRGSSLNQESQKKVWETTVGKLRTNFNSSISKKLKISFDGLEDEAKEVFLDIACFLKGRNRDYVASILDDCDCWLEGLIHKSLITVSDDSHKTIQMHDLLQDLGRDIVRKQSPTDPGKRSRLWAPQDVESTLKNNAGTNAVQGIFLDMSKIKDMHLNLEAFNRMDNLRLLKFYNSNKNDNKTYDTWLRTCYTPKESGTQSLNKVHFREGQNDAPLLDMLRSFIWFGYPLATLLSKFNPLLDMLRSFIWFGYPLATLSSKFNPPLDMLRSFIWFGYPLATLSSKFNPENLVELNLSCSSNLERLWGDTEDAPKLKWLDLHDCPRLIEVPDLSKSPSLEKIDLHGCSYLTKIQNLSNLALLEEIDLYGCSRLTEIPDLSGSPSLKSIDLEGCRSLLDFPLLAPSCLRDLNIRYEHLESLDLSGCIDRTTFPRVFRNIKSLNLSCTAIDKVPPSIENLIRLSHLNLSNCTKLEQISTEICKLKSLKELNLENCSQLESFPEISEEMEGLEILILSGTAIKELPLSIENLNGLSKLYLSRCRKLESLPCNLISLKYLDISDCSKLEILSENFGNLKSLEHLSMDRVAVSDCILNIILEPFQKKKKKILEDIGCLSSLKCLELSGNNFKSLPKSMKQLYKLTSLKVDNCNMLRSLTDLPSALKHLSASGCKQLRSIPKASEFANLVDAEFIFTNCLNLKETAVGNMLATLKEGYEKGDEIGKLTFCFPGSKVPKWFMYRTEGSSIVECCELNFRLPWHYGSYGRPLLGFVVCVVIAFEKYCCIKDDSKFLFIDYEYTGSDGDESSLSKGGMRFGVGNEILIDSDHIAFQFRLLKISFPRIFTSGFSNWSFKFRFSRREKNSNCRIKSSGVCPIYAKHNITLPS